MPQIILPGRRLQLPQGIARINWSNPFAKGLLEYTQVTPHGLYSPIQAAFSSNLGTTPVTGEAGRSGVGRKSDASTQYERVSLPKLPALTKFTLYARVALLANGDDSANPSGARQFYGVLLGGTDVIGAAIISGASGINGTYNFGANRANTSIAVTIGQEYDVFLSHPGGSAPYTLEVLGVGSNTSGATSLSYTPAAGYIQTGFASSSALPGGRVLFAGGLWDYVLSADQRKELAASPAQLFLPEKRILYFDVGAGGGVTPVSQDLADSYAVRAAVSQDLIDSYTIRSAIAAEMADSYTVLSSIAADLADSYAISASVFQDISESYLIRASVAQDIADSYAIRSAVSKDIADSYSIENAGTVASDLSDSYLIRTIASADLSDSSSIRAAVITEIEDAYVVRAAVTNDLQDGYNIVNAVASDLVDISVIRAAVVSDLLDAYSVFSGSGTGATVEEIVAAIFSAAQINPLHVDVRLFGGTLDGSLTGSDALRIMLAALAGKREGLGTATERYYGQDGTTPRITLTPDQYGNGTPTVNGS